MGTRPLLCAALAALLLSAASAQEPDWTRHVTPDTFEEEVFGKRKHVLIRYCAPWSSECRQMYDSWNLVCKEFRHSATVSLLDIDCDEHHGLCSKYGVHGYPTLKYFVKGNRFGEVYRGGFYFEELYHLVKNTVEKRPQAWER
eukprot:TRINITY_DN2535_c2_g1_i2.p1 TRINITY_DN2535_c2_g1~~TRINITY_DN2535_c2_g1_i2.p1  ORF type:complete len:168 (+),score=54.12 TRINITY_DN2535_c2_g1_i2:78-506(+)